MYAERAYFDGDHCQHCADRLDHLHWEARGSLPDQKRRADLRQRMEYEHALALRQAA
jgi:hypothetical protein